MFNFSVLLTAPPLPVSVLLLRSCSSLLFNHSLIAHYSCFAVTEHADYKVCTLSDAVFLWSVQSSVTSCFWNKDGKAGMATAPINRDLKEAG